MARPPAIETETAVRIVLDVSSVGLSDDQYFRLCRDNRDLRIEMTAQKQLIIMSPTNMEKGRKNAKISMRLGTGAEQDGTGECFDSSSEFTLPNPAFLPAILSCQVSNPTSKKSSREPGPALQ